MNNKITLAINTCFYIPKVSLRAEIDYNSVAFGRGLLSVL